MAHWFRVIVILLRDDWSSISSTQIVTHDRPNSTSRGFDALSGLHRYWVHIMQHVCQQNSHAHKIK